MFPSAAPASTDQPNVHNVKQTETLIQVDIGENDDTDGWWQTLDEELIVPSRNKKHLTRKEKREQRLNHQQKQKVSQTQLHPLDISMSEFKDLQQKDPTLQQIKQAAEGRPSTAGIEFFQRDGLLYQRWICQDKGLKE